MGDRHIPVATLFAVLGGAENVLTLFPMVGFIDSQLVIIGQVFRQQCKHFTFAASCPKQNVKCQEIGFIAEFLPQNFILVFRYDKHFPGNGGTHIAGRIARIELQTVECLGIVKEGSQLCMNGILTQLLVQHSLQKNVWNALCLQGAAGVLA